MTISKEVEIKGPKTKAEIANWCIVNALRLPGELIVSITAKLMQHLTDEQRSKVLYLSSAHYYHTNCGSKLRIEPVYDGSGTSVKIYKVINEHGILQFTGDKKSCEAYITQGG